ncbi:MULTISPECIES: hypothetical protein [unclassified Guyparkeria]|uniref:hypothetical protein n=1 Tax=unclassified Guyparkeria TaxID=2626246 RepID=UPI000733623A|nr:MULTISPECIES: hypothetical protein [unclassified Guyparkeria]KTG16392.1 hypothetical protein AUR63_03295 [Guyparkeria sp. XI15]OAE85332.1 hypothetical protein AWR35_03300 [Guyparkeria sp. WRN-7]
MGQARSVRVLLMSSFLVLLSFTGLARAEFQPFVEGTPFAGDVEAAVAAARAKLAAEGLDVVGGYAPTEGVRVLAVSSDALRETASKSKRGGYGAVVSIAFEQTGGETRISYQNPQYIAHGYRLEGDNESAFQALAGALGATGYFGGEPISKANLRTYQYAFGLETFVDPVDLGSFPGFSSADRQITERVKNGELGTELVYRVEIPGKRQIVYGVAMQTDDPNAHGAALVQAVDHDAPRGYAFLPYPVLLDGNAAETLNLRFRMALFFPDLPMMGGEASFFKLRSAPDAINKLLIAVVDGEIQRKERSGGGFGTF